MKARYLILLLLLTSLSTLAQNVAQQPSVTLLIDAFNNATGDKQYNYLAQGMNDLLLDCVASPQQNITVVDRHSLSQRHDELTFKPATGYQGESVGASHLLRGSLIRNSSGLTINLLVFDMATTQLVHAASLPLQGVHIDAGACLNWRTQLIKSASAQRAITLQPELFPERQALLDAGISYFHTGESARTISHFLRLSHEYPGDPVAEYWLARSLHQAGLTALAELQINRFLERHPDEAKGAELQQLLQVTSKVNN